MASQTANKKNPLGLSEKQLRKIWSEMPPAALVERLRRDKPGNRWSASGNRITGCCPYHEDRTPSFQIYLDRCYAKCFGCGQFVWNPVDFWAFLTGADPIEALTDLKQTFGLSFITQTVTAQFSQWQRNQALKTKIVRIAHEAMIDVLNDPENSHPAMREAVEWLVVDRKMPVQSLASLDMLGVMPPVGRILEKLDAEAARENAERIRLAEKTGARLEVVLPYTEPAREYLKQVTQPWVGSILFRYDIAPSAPGRLKLRRPKSRDFIFLEDEYLSEIGFFGLGWEQYNHLLGPQQRYLAGIHLVEGEFDALTLMSHQMEAFGGPRIVVVGAGGSSTASSVDTLYSAGGVEEVYLFGDAPRKDGDKLIAQWLPNVKKLRARIFSGWSEYPAAGDPDEAVLQHGVADVVGALSDTKNKKFFQAPQEWVIEQAAGEMLALDEADVRKKVEVASRWGSLLKNDVECDAYVEVCSRTYGLPVAGLRRNIMALDEDEPAFGYRLANLLQKEFFVIGQQAENSDRVLWLWHRKKKSVVKILLGDENCIERELAIYFGPLYHFFNTHVGIPTFMQPLMGSKDGGPWLPRFNKAARQQVSNALMHLAQEAVDMSMGALKAQGIHVLRGDEPEIYVVNGSSIYHGSFAGDALKWAELDGPAHNGNLFDVGLKNREKEWMHGVTELADLERANIINLRTVYDRLSTILDLGWKFKHHQSAVKFMTAHLMAASVGAAFKRQPVVGIHAESSSGKSRLLMGLISGIGFPELHVLSVAVGLSQYSSAGVRQYMADKARPLALDEFEHEGAQDKKTKTVKDVLETFRNLTGEDNTVTYGSRSGKATSQKMSMFVFVAAITRPEKVQDANRMIPIELVKCDREPPEHVVRKELGVDFVRQLRDDMEIALLPHVKKIQQHYAEVAAYFSRSENLPRGIESRFMEGLMPAVTVLKLLGMDYKAFVAEFCGAREFDVVKTAEQSETAQLLNWILESPQVMVRTEPSNELQKVSLLSLLATVNQRRTINNLNTGLYYDEAENLLVVNWTQAIQTVLRQHPKYSRETNTFNIREIANRHATALKPLEVQQCGVIQRLKKYGLAAMGLQSLSVFRLSQVLRSFEVEDLGPSNGAQIISINKDLSDETPDFFGTA